VVEAIAVETAVESGNSLHFGCAPLESSDDPARRHSCAEIFAIQPHDVSAQAIGHSVPGIAVERRLN
jgi:hypothetical protein